MPQAETILIPGNMCDARLWADMPDMLVQAGHRVLHADTTQDDTISAMAARALSQSDGPLVPVGFSMGGIVALEMLRQAPERLAGLALIGTNPGADLPERAAARPGHQQRVRAGELETILRKELMPVYLAKQNQDDAALRELIVSMAMDMGEDVFVRQSEALRTRSDNWGMLPGFAKPAFVACGAEDVLCPPEWHRRIAAGLPQAQLQVEAGSGHMLPLEQSAILGAALCTYIDRIVAEDGGA